MPNSSAAFSCDNPRRSTTSLIATARRTFVCRSPESARPRSANTFPELRTIFPLRSALDFAISLLVGRGLQEVLALCRVEGLEPVRVVREGDRVHEALERSVAGGGHLRGETVGGALRLHVAHEHGAARQERLERPAALLRAHAVDNAGSLVLERLADRPRDAALVGDAEDKERLFLKPEEAHGAPPGAFQATEKLTESTRVSPRFIAPDMA